MNKTANYQLSQWEKTDKVLMDDFNADNAAIDAALKAQADALAEKADVSTVNALSSRLTARNCRVVTQSYTGNGNTSRTYVFPSRPLIVHAMGMNHWLCAIQGSPKGSGRYVDGGGGQLVGTSWSGNTLTVTSPNADASFMCNWSGEQYTVVAVVEAS